MPEHFRKTEQELMPAMSCDKSGDGYALYPSYPVGADTIMSGHHSLARLLQGHAVATFDGYIGVFWNEFREQLTKALSDLGREVDWYDASEWMLSNDEISRIKEPFLGGNDPLFGTRFTGTLADFFGGMPIEPDAPSQSSRIVIAYGCGAALANWSGPLFYLDLPKNEIQFRSRAGKVHNLGHEEHASAKEQYKCFYFVDWVALNRHKQEILPRLDWLVDEQNPQVPTVTSAKTFKKSLQDMSTTVFRVRPWFEPGPWGGQWLRDLVPDLPESPPNYAWSFELIVPENGIVLDDGASRLEFSFDWLMFAHHREVLGDCASRFEYEFPIRFDYLDTMQGGNLSVQCHPATDYIRKHFGETYTQDECYYILDCKPGSQVYLGFQEDLDAGAFRSALEESAASGDLLDVDKYIQSFPSEKHGLYLIPSGTVHCSGADSVVLEISATPYIFTFKMYDWQRLDLEGKPRQLNIERAFENLDFTRRGDHVESEFISQPQVLSSGSGWKVIHLPTHAGHFYDVHRLEFDDSIEVETDGSAHVLMLVDGSSVTCVSGKRAAVFSFGETFVVPAAAEKYRLINRGDESAYVIKAYVKDSAATPRL